MYHLDLEGSTPGRHAVLLMTPSRLILVDPTWQVSRKANATECLPSVSSSRKTSEFVAQEVSLQGLSKWSFWRQESNHSIYLTDNDLPAKSMKIECPDEKVVIAFLESALKDYEYWTAA